MKESYYNLTSNIKDWLKLIKSKGTKWNISKNTGWEEEKSRGVSFSIQIEVVCKHNLTVGVHRIPGDLRIESTRTYCVRLVRSHVYIIFKLRFDPTQFENWSLTPII